jgi:hypothetical protein
LVLQQWLRERVTVLLYAYFAFLVMFGFNFWFLDEIVWLPWQFRYTTWTEILAAN